jgi:predicted negative regulator of RcsB-dependent stress response
MDRQHRHDLKHDKFVDEIGVLSSKARENQRLLFAITAAFIALALMYYGYRFYSANREDSAQQLLATAIETFEAPVGAATPEQPATTGPRFKTEAEKLAAADKQFKEVQSKFGGSDAADVASLYLARIAASKGDTAGSRKLLDQFVAEHGDHVLAGTARYSLYQIRIDSGEAEKVAAELEAELARTEPNLPGDSLLILLARAYDVQGKGDKSLEAWRRITVEFPESAYAVDAQRRLGT